MLSGQLAVVVQHGVKWHVRIAHIVREPRREEEDVEAAERAAAPVGLERALQIPKHFFDAPRQRAVVLDAFLAEFANRRRVVTRQPGVGVLAVSFPVQIQEMVGVFLGIEASHLPCIRIDRSLDERGGVLLEQRPDLGW